MAQLHFYVPDEIAESVKRKAREQDIPVSRFLAELVKREVATGWPENYANKVFGRWHGEPLVRPEQGDFEDRNLL